MTVGSYLKALDPTVKMSNEFRRGILYVVSYEFAKYVGKS